MISIDTLRADALKNPRLTFFSDFAETSAVFERAYTTAPITLPAHTSMMSGLFPPSHGVRNNGMYKAPDSLLMLPEVARDNGLNTAAFIGAFPLAGQFGLNQGFEIYDDQFNTAATPAGTFAFAERNAEQVRLSAQKWLEAHNNEKPFFLFLHFFDPHHPYLSHGYNDLQPYHQEVAYVDFQLAQFFEFLKQRNLRENNLIVITSDHGEAFGEHGELSHTLFVYNTTLHIPLMIQVPGIDPQKRTEVVRIVDLLPTVAEITGWKLNQRIDGVSLLPLMQGKTIAHLESYSETFAPALDFGWSPLAALQDSNHKYIHAPRPEFYDLITDPEEKVNRFGPKAAEYKKKVEAILNMAQSPEPTQKLNAEEREKLASLGYISSGAAKIKWDAPDPKDRIGIARQIAELAMSNQPLAEKAHQYETLLQKDPSNPLMLLRYGEVLLKLQHYQFAELAFRKALETGYSSPAPYNGLAAALYYQERIPEAEEILQRAVNAGLADGETYFNLAEFLYNRGKREEAFAYYDRSIQLGYRLAAERKASLQ